MNPSHLVMNNICHAKVILFVIDHRNQIINKCGCVHLK